MGKPQSQETASAMKYLWILVLFSVAFAEPEAEADPNAAADPNAEADPWLLYGGLRHYGYYPRYYGHYGLGYGHYGLWGRKKREAEPAPIAAADPNAVADPNAEADPYLLYGGYYGLGHHGYYWPRYGLGYGHGLVWGRKKREAEPVPTADANADPWLLYGHGGYLGGYYGGYLGGYGLGYYGRGYFLG